MQQENQVNEPFEPFVPFGAFELGLNNFEDQDQPYNNIFENIQPRGLVRYTFWDQIISYLSGIPIVNILFPKDMEPPPILERHCRKALIPRNINTIGRGQYCIIHQTGGGYLITWYYYQRLDGRHMLIFMERTIDGVINCTGREISSRPRYHNNMVYFGDEKPVSGFLY
jgi:hypothetical protein